MKIHLMIITATLSFCITHNCEAQDAKKGGGDACSTADECQSNVCADQKCAPVKKNKEEACAKAEDCKSNVCTDDKKCGDGTAVSWADCDFDEECASKICSRAWRGRVKGLCE